MLLFCVGFVSVMLLLGEPIEPMSLLCVLCVKGCSLLVCVLCVKLWLCTLGESEYNEIMDERV